MKRYKAHENGATLVLASVVKVDGSAKEWLTRLIACSSQAIVVLPVILTFGRLEARSWVVLAAIAVAAATTGRVLDIPSIVGVSVSMASIAVLCVEATTGSFRLGGSAFGFALVASVTVATFCVRAINGPSHELSTLAPSALVLSALMLPTLGATEVTGLSRIVGNFGEDNGAWLIALARSSEGASTVLTDASGNHGGPATGFMLATVRFINGLLRSGDVAGLQSNGLVLYRAYLLVAVIACLVAAAIASRLTEHWGRLTASASGMAAAVVVFSFSMGLVTVGHFSALVAVACGLTSLRVLVGRQERTRRGLSASVAAVCLVAVGQSWFPLTGVGLIFTAVLGVTWLVTTIRGRSIRQLIVTLSLSFLVVLVIAWILYVYVLDTYLQNVIDFSYILDNLRLAGGYPNLRIEVGFLVLLVGVHLVFRPVSDEGMKLLVGAAVGSFLLPLLFLLVVTFAVPPHIPQYGLYKYLYIFAAVVAPLGIGLAVRVSEGRLGPGARASIPIMTALGFLLLAPPGDKFGWTDMSRATSNDWAVAVVSEIGANPDRVVGCLNTRRGDTDNDYQAYFCSRIAFGLAGRDSLPDLVWTAANICSSPASQVKTDIPPDYYSRLTVVVSDGRRRSSGAGCQTKGADGPTGWTSSVDWDAVRIVDFRGRIVNPLFP